MSGDEDQRGRLTLEEATRIIEGCMARLECHGLQVAIKRREGAYYHVVFSLGDETIPYPIPLDTVSDYQPDDMGDLRSYVLEASSQLHRRKSAG